MSDRLPFKSRVYGIERFNTGDERADNRCNYLVMSLGYMSLCASAYSFLERTKKDKFESIRLGKFSTAPLEEDADNKRLMSIGCKLAACDYCYEKTEDCDMSFRYYPTFATRFADSDTRIKVVKTLIINPRISCLEAINQEDLNDEKNSLKLFDLQEYEIDNLDL